MAPESRRYRPALSDQVLREACRFDFFQAVRLLEQMVDRTSSGAEAARPRRYPVGHDHAPALEVVRFQALPSRSFPTGSISEIRPAERRSLDQPRPSVPEMVVAFMGLTGPNGVLPEHYTTLLIERVRQKDLALRDFFDLFNHRVISLFYRAWEKYRFPVAYERAQRGDTQRGEDLFTRCLYSVLGLGADSLRNRVRFDDEAFLYYGGYFAHWPRSAISLELMLSDYLELPTRLSQFQGQWLCLSPDDQSSLPEPRWPQGLNSRLGSNAVIGERVWDVESKFRVVLGPLGYTQFRRFVPSADDLLPLCQMVRSYAGPQFDFDVQVVLKAEEVPWCCLGGDGTDPSCLGWNTWVRSRPFQQHVDDAIFSLEGLP